MYDDAVGRAAARAVRHRNAWLAHLIDRAVDHFGPESRVLSVACGHLREGEDGAAVRHGWMEEFVALDAGDMETLMGWQLICRDLADLERLAADVPRDQLEELRVHEAPFGAIGYLELRRR